MIMVGTLESKFESCFHFVFFFPDSVMTWFVCQMSVWLLVFSIGRELNTRINCFPWKDMSNLLETWARFVCPLSRFHWKITPFLFVRNSFRFFYTLNREQNSLFNNHKHGDRFYCRFFEHRQSSIEIVDSFYCSERMNECLTVFAFFSRGFTVNQFEEAFRPKI